MSFELILAARNGDDSAFAELSKNYTPLIESMTGKYVALTESFLSDGDDLRQEASLAFYRAVMTYDLTQDKVSFGLYAKICIRNRLVGVLRSLKKKAVLRDTVSDNVMGRLDTFPFDGNELFSVSKKVLTKRERAVLLLYVEGKSYKDISSVLGITAKSVDNALYRAKTKVRRYYSDGN